MLFYVCCLNHALITFHTHPIDPSVGGSHGIYFSELEKLLSEGAAITPTDVDYFMDFGVGDGWALLTVCTYEGYA